MPVQVKFGANTKDLEDGTKRASDALQNFSTSAMGAVQDGAAAAASGIGSLTSAVGDLNDTISSGGKGGGADWLKMLLGGGVVVGAATGVLALLQKTNQEMLDLEGNARRVGLSLADFQSIRYGANLEGVSNDKFVSSLDEAAKKLNDIKYGETELSKLLDANGVKYKDQNGQLISMNSYLRAAFDLVQKGANEQERIKALDVLGLGKEWLTFAEQGSAALAQVQQKARAAGAVLDDAVVHKDAEFARRWNESATQWATYIKSAVISVTSVVNDLIGLLGKAAQEAKRVADELKPAVEHALQAPGLVDLGVGTPGGNAADFSVWERLARTVHDLDVMTSPDRLARVFSAPGEGLPATQRLNEAFQALGSNVEKAASAGAPVLGWLETVTGKAAAALKSVATVANAPAGGAGAGAAPGSGISFPKDDKDSHTAYAELQGQIQAANLAYQTQVEKINTAAALFRITERQKTTALVAEIDKREQVELAAADKALASGNLTEKEQQRVEDEKTKIVQQAVLARTKVNDDEAKKQMQVWEQATGRIASAFSSQLGSILAGTESFGQGMQKAFASLATTVVENLAKVAIELSLLTAVEAAMNVIAPGSASTINAFIGAAFSGTLPKFDVGTNYVAQTGMAIVHQGEQIKPAVGTGPYTGGGDNSINFGDMHLHNHGGDLTPQKFADLLHATARGNFIDRRKLRMA